VKFQALLPNGKFWRKIQRTSIVVKSDIGPEKAMRRTEKLVAKQGLVIKAIAAEYLGEIETIELRLECSPKTEPEDMRESGAERRRNSHEKEKTHTGRNHQKAA
jgi:hypothetical protein